MRLWRALERLRGWSGVRSAWREHLGDELDLLGPLLRPIDQLAMSVSVAGHAEPFRVVHHGEDDVVAVDPETGDAVAVDRADLVIYRLDAEVLLRVITAALGLTGTPAPVDAGGRLWWLGEYSPVEGERFPVYLAIARDAADLAAGVGTASALAAARPFVLVTPTRAGAGEGLERVLEGRGVEWIALEEVLHWRGRGAMATRTPVADVLRGFVARHVGGLTTRNKPAARFLTPPGATWEHVAIRFRDGHTISVTVMGRSAVLGYADLGMSSSKNNAPTRQWELLRVFADERGLLTWASRKASPRHRKQKQLLADALRRFFGIGEDPFVQEDGGWRARFRVDAES